MRNDQSSRQPEGRINRMHRALALAGLLGLPLASFGQAAPLPFEAEGRVTHIYAHPDGSAVDLTVFGQVFRIPKGASIHTPSASLTLEQLADPTRFPGRVESGFLGGTAILIGQVVTDANGTSYPLISSVEIEPSETVLLGMITKNDAGALALHGVPMVESTDYRLPSEGYHNEFGFPIKPHTIPVGSFAAIEGYYAEDGNFHHFLVEAGAGELVDPNTPQSSILRARCDPGGRLEVQGASYLPAGNTVDFYNVNGFWFGSITATADLEQPDFGTYRFRADVNEGEPDTDGACPSQVKAVTRTNSTTATASVDGVEPPPAEEQPNPAPNEAPVAVDDAAAVFVNLATEVHLTLNDTDANGNLDPTTIQLSNVPPGLAVQDLDNGDVMVTAAASGVYSFNYTVADTGGLVSNVATVTITADPVAMDTVAIERANYRTDGSRWNVRGTVNQPGQQVTVTLVRTGQTIATAAADATGAWALDVRNSPAVGRAGDIVRAVSNGGGNAELVVNVR